MGMNERPNKNKRLNKKRTILFCKINCKHRKSSYILVDACHRQREKKSLLAQPLWYRYTIFFSHFISWQCASALLCYSPFSRNVLFGSTLCFTLHSFCYFTISFSAHMHRFNAQPCMFRMWEVTTISLVRSQPQMFKFSPIAKTSVTTMLVADKCFDYNYAMCIYIQ